MSLEEFGNMISGRQPSAALVAFERDYGDLAAHVAGMNKLLTADGRGGVAVEEGAVSNTLDVVLTLTGRNIIVATWIVTGRNLEWQRSRGTLTYPLTAFEYINYQARDAFINALNADVARAF